MFENTKKLCDLFMKMGIPAIDLIVYKDGKCVLRHMDGYADPQNKIPVTGKEKYHIYSCSKLFTCVAAMQLWEKGLFSLEDKLCDYMPAFKQLQVKTEAGLRPAEKPVLIKHLFEMTAGMTYELRTPELEEYYKACGGTCSTWETVQQFAKTPLVFEPGEGWRYSLCHDVLAALVEQLSGQRFEAYAKEHIFDPLGMEHTDFLHPMEDWAGFARQFRYNEKTCVYEAWWKNAYRPGSEYASGGAGCVSTVEDYIKFLEALRIGDVILKKETIALMSAERLTEQQRSMYSYGTEDIGYGLGMRTYRMGSKRTEFGWGGAAGAFASVDIENGVTIYFAQHVLLAPNRSLRRMIYDAVMADLRGEPFQIPERALPMDPSITY